MGTLDLSTDSRLTHFSIWFGRFPFRVQNKAKSGWVMGSCVRSAARQVQSNVENALIRIRFKLICISQWPRKPTREAQLVSSWVEMISSAGCAIETKSFVAKNELPFDPQMALAGFDVESEPFNTLKRELRKCGFQRRFQCIHIYPIVG